ncbi:hypothetical protein [Arthrobacter sp. 4R501]|uniref:hypothetical protein n=1 Tax=Arthrobacter sp. 4R501 TaxID=2058886 RepID=UPI0021588FF1|nr:hypothetical protein [Arthrobacter sp. 4R501]
MGLARQIGAAVVAEGIETPAELVEVTEPRVTAAQGYLLGRPSVHPLDWSAWRLQADLSPAELRCEAQQGRVVVRKTDFPP